MFLKESSEEISLRHPIAIAFYLPKGEIDHEKQEKCIQGLHNFFTFNKQLAMKALVNSNKLALRYFLIGMIFLVVAILFEHQFEKGFLFGVLQEGLFIGGWVFAWEALTTAAFQNRELRRHISEWERFLDAPIVFKKEHRPDQVFD